jgi:hypothetical protein
MHEDPEKPLQLLVRTADARYQAVRLRARLIASKARKAFCRQGLQGFEGFAQGSARQSLRQLSRHTKISGSEDYLYSEQTAPWFRR